MRPTNRLFELIEILRQTKRPISAEAIARKLEVSKRTVYRDVATLIAQHVPIVGEAGMGYVLESGFHMPPLMLTALELEAAVLGVQWVASRGEPELANAALSLLTKIKTISPASAEAIFVDPTTSVAPASNQLEALGASFIRSAIRNRNKMWISYEDEHGRVSERIIWPLLLGYRDTGRIIAAWCELRQQFRYFRTERIDRAHVLVDRIPLRMVELREKWRLAMDAERLRYKTGP